MTAAAGSVEAAGSSDSRSGGLLTRVGLGCGLWLVGVCVLAWPLAALGWWTPWLAWPLAVVLGALAWFLVRRLPGVVMTTGAAGALVALCVGFAVYAGATHSEHVLVRRDAASNLQAAVSLATTHDRVVPVDVSVIGGGAALDRRDVSVGSSAFYQVGPASSPSVQPQFLLAPAVVYGYGWWAGGASVAQVLPAVAMALVLVLLGLLVAAVTSSWWGVAAAGLTGVLFPVLNVARGTYSEQLALVTMVGGLLAVTMVVGRDAGRAPWSRRSSVSPAPSGEEAVRASAAAPEPGSVDAASAERSALGLAQVRRLALVGGILLGGTGFARIDALREVLLLLPLLAVGSALGGRWVRPLLTGMAASTVLAFAAAWSLSYRYLGDIAASLVPLVVMAVGAAAVSAGGLWWWRRRELRSASRGGNTQASDPDPVRVATPRRWAGLVRRGPDLAAVLVVVVGLGLVSRPLWMTVRQDPNDPGARYVAGMQRRQGLPVDGGRTYAEHTVDWLSWYVGWVALAVALAALALALRFGLRRMAERRLEPWLPMLVVLAGSTVLTLLRPGITPDHPWADRRLLIALPFVVALVVVAAWWGARRLAGSGRRWATGVVAVALVAVVGVPAVVATWPFRGVGVERGSLAAVSDVCGVLEPGDVVLGIDARSTSEWPQVVRGMCGVPSFIAATPVRKDPARLEAVVSELSRGAAASGHRLVLLAADGPDALEALGLDATPVVDTRFAEEEHALDRRPFKTDRGGIRVFTAVAPTP